VLFALLVAVSGYFLDLECLVNQCEAHANVSVEHSECISPVVLPDTVSMPATIAEFSFLPLLVDIVALCEPVEQVSTAVHGSGALRPPPAYLLCATASCRRGPPVRA
jgi:hypothetical protein